MKQLLRRARGISLVDLLVAFTVFSVAIMCTLTIFPTSMKTIRKARLASMASHLAESALEDVLSQDFASISASTVSTTSLSTTINGSTDTVDFTSTVTTTTVSTSLKDVTVVVTYYDQASDKAASTSLRSYKLETMVADRPTASPSP